MSSSPLPEQVTIRDVTLREFGQNVPASGLRFFDVGRRLRIALSLIEAGLSTLEVASTASPKVAPAMAPDLLRPFLQKLGRRRDVELVTLVPSDSGFRRFLQLGLGPDELGHSMGVFLSAVDEHNQANLRRSVAESLAELGRFVPEARRLGVRVHGYVSAAFGFRTPSGELVKVKPERVGELARRFEDLGVETITLSDLQGLANPTMTVDMIQPLLSGTQKVSLPLGYHPHHISREAVLDTVEEVARVGVRLFDASLDAVGGCVTGAPGNAPTEDVVHRLESIGFHCHIDQARLNSLAFHTKTTIFSNIL